MRSGIKDNLEFIERVLRLGSLGIAGSTVLAGAAQAAAPSLVLRVVGADRSTPSRQLFATVGMFMVITGGTLGQAGLQERDARLVLFWSVLQKLGAVGAVAIGVRRGVFARRALLVAGFDLLSALALTGHLLVLQLLGRQAEDETP